MAQHRGGLRRLLRGIWRLVDTARKILFNLLFLLVLVIVLVALFRDGTPTVPAGGALVVAPTGVLVDQRSYVDPLASLSSGGSLGEETLLSDLIRAIDTAAYDDRISMIVLQLDAMQHGGLSKVQELAQALQRFRQRGKQIVAVGDSFSQDQYWLAAQADTIYLNPMGAVLLEGYGVFTHYFREALDKLAVKFHVFRVGTYKAAVEPFLRNEMSAAARQNNMRWLQALWDQYKTGVAAQRGFTSSHLDDYIAGIDDVLAAHDGDAAAAALQWQLVDGLKTRRQVDEWLVGQVGADEEGRFRAIHAEDYLLATRHLFDRVALPKVGIIVASGMILDGEQRPGLVGGDTLAGLIREARFDDAVRAVVLRIDSEGGSAFASEIIRQELLALKAAGKPWVVSMGSVAASGGYWIAADADYIYTTPATLTGSIGIFGVLPAIDETLQRLGIHADGVGTTPLTGTLRIDRPLVPTAARAIQSTIEHGYRQFVGLVAEGRELSPSRVDAMGQGQIWAGSEAVELGLADGHGTLSDAVAHAGRLANLSQFHPQVIQPPMSPGDLLLQQLTGGIHAWLAQAAAPWWTPAALFAGAGGGPGAPGSLLFLPKPEWWNDPMAAYTYCLTCGRL